MTAELPLPDSKDSAKYREKSPRRLRIIAVASGLIVLIAGLGVGFWLSRTRGKTDLAEITVPVASENLRLRITTNGQIVPFQSVNLSPKASGVLVQLMVEQGDRVEKGQVVALMDRSNLEGQLIQAQAAVNQAQARLAELVAGTREEEKQRAEAAWNRTKVELAQRQLNQPQQLQEVSDQVREAQAQLQDAQAQLTLAQTRYQRFKSLVDQGAESRDRLNEAERNYDSAQAQLNQAKTRVDQAKNQVTQVQIRTAAEIAQAQTAVNEAYQSYQLALSGNRPEVINQARAEVQRALGQMRTIQNQIEDTIIRAPFDGIVTQKYASEGAFVTPTTSASSTSSATSTSIIALARDLEVVAEVPEVDIGQVKQGQPVEIRADAFPNQVFQGRVRLVAPEAVVEQNVTSFQVRVGILTGQDQLRSGMNSDLTFLGETLSDTLVVPTVAIATQKGQTGVYIPDDKQRPEFKPVTIGTSVQDKTQILDGLTKSDRVFIDFPPGLEPEAEE